MVLSSICSLSKKTSNLLLKHQLRCTHVTHLFKHIANANKQMETNSFSLFFLKWTVGVSEIVIKYVFFNSAMTIQRCLVFLLECFTVPHLV